MMQIYGVICVIHTQTKRKQFVNIGFKSLIALLLQVVASSVGNGIY